MTSCLETIKLEYKVNLDLYIASTMAFLLYNTRMQTVNLDQYIVPTMGFLYNSGMQTINLDLYIVSTIRMFKYQKDQSIKTGLLSSFLVL